MDFEQRRAERAEELSGKVQSNEPLVDTIVLDALDEADLPLRGEARQRVLRRVRAQVRQRRTVDGVAARISSNLVSPITTAMEQELDERVRTRITERIQSMAEQGDNQ